MIEHGPQSGRVASSLQLVQGPDALRLFYRILYGAMGATVLALVVVPWQQNVPAAGRVVGARSLRPDPDDRRTGQRSRPAGLGHRGNCASRRATACSRSSTSTPRSSPDSSSSGRRSRPSSRRRAAEGQGLPAPGRGARREAAGAGRPGRPATSSKSPAPRSARPGMGSRPPRLPSRRRELNYERQKQLFDEGLASELEFEVAERIYKQAKAELSQGQQALAASLEEEKARRAELGRARPRRRRASTRRGPKSRAPSPRRRARSRSSPSLRPHRPAERPAHHRPARRARSSGSTRAPAPSS